MRHTTLMTGQNRRFRAEWIALVALLLLLSVVLAVGLNRAHHVAGTAEGERLQVQARVIDENLVGQLEGAEKALAFGGPGGMVRAAQPHGKHNAQQQQQRTQGDPFGAKSSVLARHQGGVEHA